MLAAFATLSLARTVVVDAGANCGNSYEKLLRIHHSQLNRTDLEAYLWEANPRIIVQYLQPLARRDPRVVLMPYACSTTSGHTTFHLTSGEEHLSAEENDRLKPCDPFFRKSHGPMVTSSLLSGVSKNAGTTPVVVEQRDFSAWVLSLGLRRADTVVFKIDIEFAEYSVLGQLMDSAFDLCIVDRWYVEWHPLINKKVLAVNGSAKIGSGRSQGLEENYRWMKSVENAWRRRVAACGDHVATTNHPIQGKRIVNGWQG
jgi:FkbM family methyltransferase